MKTRKKLMVVEDSQTQARVIAAHLSQEVDVIIAIDGLQALRLVRVEHPDLIILDVNLPKLNGIQVCRRLKREEATQHIPIVILTAANDPEQMVEGIMAGADNYILKGEQATEQLLECIRTYQIIGKI